MANLVVDIGNSFTKLAVFNGGDLVWIESYATINAEILNNVLNTYKPQKNNCFVSKKAGRKLGAIPRQPG